jgi:aspartyl-tRNA synthetase
LDRLVGILVGAKTIRDVIAFPKSSDVKDLMSKSPAEVAMSELEHYNISVVRDK